MRGRILLGAALGFCLAAAALPVPLLAQWTGEIGGGYVWQDVTGNESAFVTQYGQYQGFLLDNFSLAYTPGQGERESFALKAWGFGGAEPAQHASLLYRTGCDWTFDITYDKQDYFYGIGEGDLASRRSRWALERWRGSIVFDGWSAARLSLNLRYYKKSGYVYRGIFGQNYVVFPTRDNYDQDMKEATVKIETKTLPVYISFEEAYTRYEREDRWQPNLANGGGPVFGTSNSTLAALTTPRNDKTNIPSSRLIFNYRNTWVDLAGSFFYSKADLDTTGTRMTTYEGYLSSGQFRWLDSTNGSASQDTKSANVDANFHLGAGWSILVAGNYRDTTQDSNLLGDHVLALGKPGGTWHQYVTPIDQNGFFDVKDNIGKFEVDKQGNGWALFAGYQGGTRDVNWKRENDDPGEDLSRSGGGWYVGGTWSKTPALRINAEYEHGTFEHYVFRTDPDVVQRFTLNLSSSLGGGWTLGARARWEWGENPADITDLRRQAQDFGANIGWANKKGDAGVGLAADLFTINTNTNIYLPSWRPAYSIYNVNLLTVTANGYFTVGKVHVSGDVTKLRDSGETWPLTNWSADLHAAIDGPKGLQFEVFGQYRSYVEDWASADNFYARRYGVIIRWRF